MSDPWRTWMPLNCSKYINDTLHLSTLEHGAYLLLIMRYWMKGSLPADDRQLANIAGLSPKQWAGIKPTIAAFFEAGWSHDKIERTLSEAEDKYRKRAKAGSEGGKAKAEAVSKRGRVASNARVNASSKEDSGRGSAEGNNATHNKHITSSSIEEDYPEQSSGAPRFEAAAHPSRTDDPVTAMFRLGKHLWGAKAGGTLVGKLRKAVGNDAETAALMRDISNDMGPEDGKSYLMGIVRSRERGAELSLVDKGDAW